MLNNYYKQKQFIAKVDRQGNIIGRIEKWEAHRKGVLHKALTVAIIYKGKFILQHRKHPAFDGVLDLTSSSHQIYIGKKLQTTSEATFECLKREWGLKKTDFAGGLKNEGAIYYKAKDPKSEFTEHEVCEMLTVKVKKLPTPNFDYAYGFSLVDKKDLLNKKDRIYPQLAPWVKKMLGKLN
jgi:isopentenyl-diphosphate Delta-isomerase